jgi:NAD-dependent dihydropyrimidine dehydrogenase PreA subunit
MRPGGQAMQQAAWPEDMHVAKVFQTWRMIGMTYVIAEPCIDVTDQACVDVCPVDCIHFEEGTDRMLYIDPDECIDCGACEPECPVEAIFTEEDVPDEWKAYTAVNATWFNDKDGARSKINELRPE